MVCDCSICKIKCCHLLLTNAVRLPDFQRFILAAADDPLAIGTECHAVDSAGMFFERLLLLTGLGIPDSQRFVHTTTDDPLAVRAEVYTGDTDTQKARAVPFKYQRLLTGLRIPDSRRVIRTSSDNPPSPGAERYTGDCLVMAFER